jgi:hypothetical protein
MPNVQLTRDEANEVKAILEDYFVELRKQIENTGLGVFRYKLQHRRRLLEKLFDQLQG